MSFGRHIHRGSCSITSRIRITPALFICAVFLPGPISPRKKPGQVPSDLERYRGVLDACHRERTIGSMIAALPLLATAAERARGEATYERGRSLILTAVTPPYGRAQLQATPRDASAVRTPRHGYTRSPSRPWQ
jgi:hypothetical protein